MGRRRFYAPVEAFDRRSGSIRLQADEARHLREVLRLKPGDEVYVFDGEGKEFRCVIEISRRDTADLKVEKEVEPPHPESPLQLTLAVALLKSDKFDLVVQKATELGVTRIVPVQTRLADIKLKDQADAGKRVTRWQRIALEAAKQSGRARVPAVAPPISFEEFLRSQDADGLKLMFSERDGQRFEPWSAENVRVTALVGSEGGWTDSELEEARAAGWKLVTLGGRTLRAETAAIVITTLLQHLFGDLR